jgi:organic radical activating enzyme
MKICNIETDITDHCNLTCAECSHHSPYISKGVYPLDQFEKDVNTFAESVQCEWFKILGGEPLLNRELSSYIDALQTSGICKKIALFTNGTLLHRVDPQVFQHIDCLVVSRYPGSDKYTEHVRSNVEKFRDILPVVHNYYDMFEAQNFLEANESPELVQQIFDRCKLRYECNAIYKGKFYKCMACVRKEEFLGKYNVRDEKLSSTGDGISLYGENLTRRFLEYYYSTTPLAACRFCTGSSGKDIPHSNKLTPPKACIHDVVCPDKLRGPPLHQTAGINNIRSNIITRSPAVSSQTFTDNDGLDHIL